MKLSLISTPRKIRESRMLAKISCFTVCTCITTRSGKLWWLFLSFVGDFFKSTCMYYNALREIIIVARLSFMGDFFMSMYMYSNPFREIMVALPFIHGGFFMSMYYNHSEKLWWLFYHLRGLIQEFRGHITLSLRLFVSLTLTFDKTKRSLPGSRGLLMEYLMVLKKSTDMISAAEQHDVGCLHIQIIHNIKYNASYNVSKNNFEEGADRER